MWIDVDWGGLGRIGPHQYRVEAMTKFERADWYLIWHSGVG